MAEKQQTTSIHIQPVKAGSEQHNKREKLLDYVMPSRTHLNEYWESDNQANRLAVLKKLIKEKTGRKIQKAATPIREGVVVIKPSTTMADLRNLADLIKLRFGIETFQIAIHRDEGGDLDHINYHAHFVMDFVDHNTGKSIKIGRAGASDLQTLCASQLQMERGQSSDTKHLNAIQFKVKQEQMKLFSLRSQNHLNENELRDYQDKLNTLKNEITKLQLRKYVTEIGQRVWNDAKQRFKKFALSNEQKTIPNNDVIFYVNYFSKDMIAALSADVKRDDPMRIHEGRYTNAQRDIEIMLDNPSVLRYQQTRGLGR